MIDRNNRAFRRLDREHVRDHYCYGGGGDSSSSATTDSSQHTTTTQVDARIATGADSVALSAPMAQLTNSNINLTITDNQAVQQSFGFARDALAGAVNFATQTQAKDSSFLQDALAENERVVSGALNQVADAYTTAKAGEQKVLVGVGVAIVAVVAVVALKGLKA